MIKIGEWCKILKRIMEDRLQMTIEIDFNSDEALYIQLRNQINVIMVTMLLSRCNLICNLLSDLVTIFRSNLPYRLKRTVL